MDIDYDLDPFGLEDQDNEILSWNGYPYHQESQNHDNPDSFYSHDKSQFSLLNYCLNDIQPAFSINSTAESTNQCLNQSSDTCRPTKSNHTEFFAPLVKTVEILNTIPSINLEPINEITSNFNEENKNYLDISMKNKKYGKRLANALIKKIFNKRKDIFLIGIVRAHVKMIKNAIHNIVSRNKTQLNYVNTQNMEQLKKFNLFRDFVIKEENYNTFWEFLQTKELELKVKGKNKFNYTTFINHFGSELLRNSFCMFIDVVFEEKNIELLRKRFKIGKSNDDELSPDGIKWMSLANEFLSKCMFLSSK